MAITQQISFESHVPTVPAAFAFIADHLEKVGDTPSFAAQHSFVRTDDEEEWAEGFHVVVSGTTEIEPEKKVDEFPFPE